MKISVALAAYKGEKYIGEQLASILPQIGDDAEIIVSDDCPCEEMRKIVESFCDGRIKYVEGPGRGVIKNFEHALKLCEGEYIFLCDQDDVWCEDKVEKCVSELQNGCLLVMHDAKIVDAGLNETGDCFFATHNSTDFFLKNVLVNSFVGCCMAFRKELKKYILPFPDKLPMHDQYIGLVAKMHGEVKLIDEPLILYRRHSNNVTGGKTTLSQKIKWRYQIVRAIFFSKKARHGG